jgi:predicted regulator of Ras-like GTPase activity (Roadblock/LC7/MglB family)
MKTPAPADLQRWSDELARNPASLAFLPLARAYRRLGRRDLALRLCLRGLEAHPAHVEAHALLALLYLEAGDRARAADEWSIVLRLKPGNFEALRGMGFRYLEQNDVPRARQHLERAALIRPDDAAVQEALRLLRQRESAAVPRAPAPVAATPPSAAPDRAGTAEASSAGATSAPAALGDAPFPFETAGVAAGPWSEPALPGAGRAPALAGTAAVPAERSAPATLARPVRPRPAPPGDPTALFDALAGTGPLHGILLLDDQGLVLAGSLDPASGGPAEAVAAMIGAAAEEAVRVAGHLALGGWRALILETAGAVLHVSPVGAQATLVVAAAPDAPTGWVARTAAQARILADRFLEGLP